LREAKPDNFNSVEELLLSVLLSDKALNECPTYDMLSSTLDSIGDDFIVPEKESNFALKTVFSTDYYN